MAALGELRAGQWLPGADAVLRCGLHAICPLRGWTTLLLPVAQTVTLW